MAEQQVPTDEHIALVRDCLSVYQEQSADWLPAMTLRDVLNERGVGLKLTDLARVMRIYGEQASEREYNDRKLRGFTRAQFLNIVEQHTSSQFEIEKEEHGHDLNVCAQHFLNWVSTLSPDYGERIEALQYMRGFDAKMTVASLIAYPLENMLHMVVPARDIFDGAPTWTPDTKVCEICGEHYTMAYPGQPPVCLKSECGRAYHKMNSDAVAAE